MKFTESRKWSFVAVFLIYVLAASVAIIVYPFLPFEPWLSLLIVDVIATVITFIFSLIFKNASVYDPYWSVQPIIIVWAYVIITGNFSAAALIPVIVISIWGIRLTANWAYTFHGLKHQDWRYTMLKETTGAFYPLINFIGIHMVPTVIVYAVTLPTVFVIITAAEFSIWAVIPAVASLAAVFMQGTADVQMHNFRKAKTGGFIRVGLWKYSRHPNYLGEILMWLGMGAYAVVLMPQAWYLIIGAVLNTILFLSVSIPMADRRQSRKDGFEEYKSNTHMLLPIKFGVKHL